MSTKKSVFYIVCGFVFVVKLYFIITTVQNSNFSDAVAYNNGDAGHYLSIAKNINIHQVYADNNSNIPNESATWRPPIWPFYISILFIFSKSIFWIFMSKLVIEILLIFAILVFFKKKINLDIFSLWPFLLLFIEPQYLKYSFTFFSESFNSILILLLTVLFLTVNAVEKQSIIIPILAAIIITCHPVSAFFIGTLIMIYCLIHIKTNFKTIILQGTLFVSLLAIWPIRNALTFNKGIYLTASQGATFSKGWNETVANNFTNVDGDLADEGLNLKYITNREIKPAVLSVLDLSKIYTEATNNYIDKLDFSQKAKIVIKKIKSNFIPFPERPKGGFLENMSTVFRIIYLILFVQLFLRIIQFKKFDFQNKIDKVYLVVISILIGQIIMASYIYTGLRFNAIYSLSLLFCLIIVNQSLLKKVTQKLF